MNYNVIATSYRNESKYLIKELNKHGDFRKTSFRDVLVGSVEDVEGFLKKIVKKPPLSLARLIPLKEVINFKKPSALLRKLKNKILELADLKNDESFRVTVERRGWKGEINSHEWAKILGEIVYKEKNNPVNLEEPDIELVVEIMKNSCGLAVIREEERDDYYFLRAK
ncbi:hypothetical protein GF352_02920 [archaeon]|nr:hypothetical protein [archaeon]